MAEHQKNIFSEPHPDLFCLFNSRPRGSHLCPPQSTPLYWCHPRRISHTFSLINLIGGDTAFSRMGSSAVKLHSIRNMFGKSRFNCTECMEWMSHRKWKETKQQPGTAGPGDILLCCLVSLFFLCDIHSIHSVQRTIWNWSLVKRESHFKAISSTFQY